MAAEDLCLIQSFAFPEEESPRAITAKLKAMEKQINNQYQETRGMIQEMLQQKSMQRQVQPKQPLKRKSVSSSVISGLSVVVDSATKKAKTSGLREDAVPCTPLSPVPSTCWAAVTAQGS